MLLLTTLVLSAGCTGAVDDTAAAPGSFPTDSSADGIRAFVATEAWRAEPWVAESEAPRDEASVTSPHGRVQVFLNDVIQASTAAGNGTYGGTAHDEGSMSIKVLVDEEDDTVLGHAAMLKRSGDFEAWVYWCEGPSSRCGAELGEDATWGVGIDTTCGICHGGNVFNTQ